MEMLVDSFLSYFGYELDFKTFFLGCQKVVALTSSELLAKIFLFNFESCPFNNISVIFFFFKFCRPSCGTHLKWVAGQDFFSQVLLAKLWHLPQVSCWPRFFSQVLSAKLWHSPQVSCWPRFFCSVLNHVHSTIFQSEEFFKVFFSSIFNCVFFNNIPAIKFCQPSCGTH